MPTCGAVRFVTSARGLWRRSAVIQLPSNERDARVLFLLPPDQVEQRLAELRGELRGEIQQVRTELQHVRTELLRWMFGFWVTTLLGIAGLLIALRAH